MDAHNIDEDNIRLKYKPMNVALFPESMLDKMSGTGHHLVRLVDSTLETIHPVGRQASSPRYSHAPVWI